MILKNIISTDILNKAQIESHTSTITTPNLSCRWQRRITKKQHKTLKNVEQQSHFHSRDAIESV